MSDNNMEIEPCVEPSNICTPVDVFDQFQSGVMYEESEFITLSDILPPQPEVSNINDDLENDDVFTDLLAAEYPQVSSQQDNTQPESNPAAVLQVSSVNSSQTGKKKRGRKPKNLLIANATPSFDIPSTIETPNSSLNGLESDTNIPSDSISNGRSKRQRKPKYVSEENDAEDSAKGKRRKTVKDSHIVVTPKTPKRRGRSKKSTLQEQPERAMDSLTTEHTQPEPELQLQETSAKTKKNVKKSQNKSNKVSTPAKQKSNKSKNEQHAEVDPTVTNGDETLLLENNIQTVDQEFKDFTNNEITDSDFVEIGEVDLDDISLSQLKDSLEPNITSPAQDIETVPETTETVVEDYINKQSDSVEVADAIPTVETPTEATELTDGKPKRARAKARSYKYGSESEEDPYANMESSDEEPRRKKKGTKYYSDDEYVPWKKNSQEISSDSASDIEIEEEEENSKRRKGKAGKSPKKGQKSKSNDIDKESPTVSTILPSGETDDIEGQLESSVILASETTPQVIPGKWGTASEFESFLKKKISGTDLKIKKVFSSQSIESVKPQLEIPTIDPSKAKIYVENGIQTEKNVSEKSVQTTSLNELVMAKNASLTDFQKAKACNFLKSIVKTTSELGQLMTEKSEEFIKKKINTDNVTDTFKMDYCVKKSYLLFKLAKHNLAQMEEDLSKQYEDFLKENALLKYAEKPKIVAPKPKESNSDSDCEIVEEKPGKSGKPTFNPKTVFLNKELSIKIAKKPVEEKNVKSNVKNIKGLKHTVWINDSVVVKKVKPTQSFLAQDSRTKKPPDSVLLEIVAKFFSDYNRRMAVAICAPFVTKNWLTVKQCQHCYYFCTNPDNTNISIPTSETFEDTNTNNNTDLMNLNGFKLEIEVKKSSPKTLFTLCIQILQNCTSNTAYKVGSSINNFTSSPRSLFKICTEHLQKQMNNDRLYNISKKIEDMEKPYNPETLFSLSLNILNSNIIVKSENENCIQESTIIPVWSLQSLCLQKVRSMLSSLTSSLESIGDTELFSINDLDCLSEELNSNSDFEMNDANEKHNLNYVFTLKSICLHKIRSLMNQVTSSIESVENTKISTTNFEFLSNDAEDSTSDFEFMNENLELDMEPVLTLKSICLEKIRSLLMNKTTSVDNLSFEEINNREQELSKCGPVLSLKAWSLQKVRNIFRTNSIESLQCDKNSSESSEWPSDVDMDENFEFEIANKSIVRSLLTLSLEVIRNKLKNNNVFHPKEVEYPPISLNKFSNDKNDNILNTGEAPVTVPISEQIEEITVSSPIHNFALTSMKTEEANEDAHYSDDNFDTNEFEQDYDHFNDQSENEETETNWVAKVQMQINKPQSDHECQNVEGNIIEQPMIANIKMEPFEEVPELNKDLPVIKSEPELDQMTIIPESVITKAEKTDDNERVPLIRQDSSSFDVDSFETFVRNNKMMRGFTDGYNLEDDNHFTQSDLRVRRQHEPDYDNDNDNTLSLLVPQTFEPFNIDVAKGSLMESSGSDNEGSSKKGNQKKTEKRGRKRSKKNISKELNKDTAKSNENVKSNVNNDVLALTKKMQDKIRHEEKKTASSESDYEDVPLSLRSEKAKKKSREQLKNLTAEIQCNNIDSTEICDTDKDITEFSGFTAIDLSGVSTYHKYAKYMYDKILDQNGEPLESENTPNKEPESPVINTDEPIEHLECEPSIPFMDEIDDKPTKKNKKGTMNKAFQKNDKIDKQNFVVREGWNCYPIDRRDKKLYSSAYVPLQKLPQTFVDTYFHYQDIAQEGREDVEINRLTNLQSLKNLPNSKVNVRSRKKEKGKKADCTTSDQVSDGSRVASPTFSIPAAELTPSEDEDVDADDVDNEPPSAVPKDDSENNQAKDSLMADQGSESDEGPLINLSRVKQEPNIKSQPPKKPGPKSKTIPENAENLMLTAEKMMNKELAMLHAPVKLDEPLPEKHQTIENPLKRPKRTSKSSKTKDGVKNEEDSSSEEEKQWVTTKEKLLKRLVKKPGDTNVEDAKRAKLVSEFIIKRGDQAPSRNRTKKGKIRSRNKFLERQKQLRILSNELYGEQDSAQIGKRSSNNFKGRRNIRKIIDKKSLTKSTVTANMEEFARKQRLITNQMLLKEELGCDEDVNVLVINDEVCLEYDFEEHQPVVTVHPFFTKVMKAHQYEGVKFMWDACFESLKMIERGDQGGGCILAHCMGLGKTLQVLALLHTVLTHPRVGMRRVLVCCPLSTVLNWVDEIHKWIGPVTDQIKVFELSKLKKTYERAYQLEDWYSGGGIFIIGYELFRSLSTLDPFLDNVRPTIVNKIRTALLDPGPDIIVCDEGHLLKNDCSVLAVAMSRVITKRRIMLTGTPMQNNLREYYCMVNFVKPNLLGTYSEYSNRFENPIINGQHRDSVEADIKLMKARTHILHKVLEGCLQRQEASVLHPYLPTKHEYTVFINLTECQWKLYKHYLDHYSKGQKKHGVLKDFHILQKVWTHPQVLHNFLMKPRNVATSSKVKPEKIEDDLAHEDIHAPEDVKDEPAELWWIDYLDEGAMLESLKSSHKLEVVFKILDECVAVGDKVLIFSTSLYTMDTLEYFLKKIKKWNLGTEYYRLDGSVPAEVRQKWCREFNAENNEKTKLFLISTRAGCLGLNLVAANRVIILDTSWNPAHDIQSIFRIYRFGQKKDCYIYRLVALGTMEQKIYERSVTKQAVACRVVDEQQIDRHYNSAELTELYRYDELGGSVARGVAAGVRDRVLLRVARAAAVHAAHEHDSLLRSTEQALDETERAAAWHQFQQEHHHKQMPTASTSTPKSIRIPVKQPPAETKPAQVTAPSEYDDQDPIQKNLLIGKITNKLLIEEYHKRVGKKISDIVELVRNIVNNNNLKQIAKDMDTITDALCGAMLAQAPAENTGPGRDRKVVDDNPEPEIQPEPVIAEDTDSVIDDSYHHSDRDSEDTLSCPSPALSPTKSTVGKTKPVKTSTQPPNVTTQPLKKTKQPVKETKQPVKETKQPVKETKQPVKETKQPVKETKQPVKETKQLVKETKQPVKETKTPVKVTKQPVIKTKQPVKETKQPVEETKQPVKETKQPVKETKQPVKETKQPVKETKSVQEIIQLFRKKEQLDNKPNDDCVEISLLSDDDEPPQPPPTIKTETIDDTASTSQETPKVPLHRSLLKNENFIKIIARKYMAKYGLDEEAALLAARYSCSKLLDEIQVTGREPVGGPLYDIAIEVLGVETLESLQDRSKNAPTLKPTPKAGPRSKNLKMSKTNEKTAETTSAKSTPDKQVSMNPSNRKPEDEAPATAIKVVPVGMFNRSDSAPPRGSDSRESESILPDMPAPALRPRGSRALTLNHVIARREAAPAAAAPASAPAPAPAAPALSAMLARPHAPPPRRPELILSDPICLDSDDEEPPGPPAAAPPGPVPVSLMAATPAALAAIPGVRPGVRLVPVTPQPPAAAPPRRTPPAAAPARQLPAVPPRPMLQLPLVSPMPMLQLPFVSQMPMLQVPLASPMLQPPAASQMPPPPPASAAPAPAPVTEPALPASYLINLPSGAAPTTPAPPVNNVIKTQKTICKPGDIFRIDQNGQVVIIQRLDDNPAVSAGAPPPVSGAGPAAQAVAPQAERARSAGQGPAAQTQTAAAPESERALGASAARGRARQRSAAQGRARQRSASTDSSDSSDGSPASPLSVLRDVVHIQAADDPLMAAPPYNPTTPLSTLKNNFEKLKERFIANKKTMPAQQAPRGGPVKKSLSKETGERIDLTKNPVNTKTVAGNSRSILIKASGKTQQLPFPSVDLTEQPQIQITNVQKIKTKPLTPVTKEKNPVIITKIQQSQSKPVVTKKRPTPNVPAVATKKRKISRPMTLKDFNLDDFDDNIIELE